MKDQFYKAVPVSEAPEKDGNYHVVFNAGEPYESFGTVTYTKHLGFYSENLDCDEITHWLRPLSLAVPEMPSEDEMQERQRQIEKTCELKDPESFWHFRGYENCYNWMLEKATALLASRDEEVKELKTQLQHQSTEVEHLGDTVAAQHEEVMRLREEKGEIALDYFKQTRIIEDLTNKIENTAAENNRLRAAAEKLCSAITTCLPNIDTGNEKDLAVYHALHELKSLTNTTPTNE